MANTLTPQTAGTNRPVTIAVPVAARILGFGEATLYRALRRGDIPCVRVGRSVRVYSDWLEQEAGRPLEDLLREDEETGA